MKKSFIAFLVILLAINLGAQESVINWCLDKPVRLIQTNLREIDMIDFNVDQYVKDVCDIGANTVLINVGGIVANYPSTLASHFVNPYLKTDIIGDVVNRLHEKNIRVIGRFDFSKLNEKIANKHPDWLYISQSGKPVNYNGQVHTCVNGSYQQEEMFKILDEALSNYPLDGVFFNMSGYQTRDYSHNYHGICQSENCKKRFAEWSNGLVLPQKEDENDPVFLKYKEFKNYTKDELYTRVQSFIKKKDPNACICTYVDKGVDLRRHESGSQIQRSYEWEYQSADNVKTVLGSYKDKQVSNAAVHFVSFAFRHASVSPFLTEKRLIQNMIHGGGLDFYCIGRLDNQEDRASLNKVKEIFQFHKQHENYFTHITSTSDICVITTDNWETHASVKGVIRFLSENHMQYDLMLSRQINAPDAPKALKEYKLVILPDISDLSELQAKQIDQFVKEGGTLLSTAYTSTKDEIGSSLNRFQLNCLGVKKEYKVFPQSKGTYFKIPEKHKNAFKSVKLNDLDLLFLYDDFIQCSLKENASGYLKFIYPAMFGPPEKCYYTNISAWPGIIYNSFGKGESVYFPWSVFKHYNDYSHHGHAMMIKGAIIDLLHYVPQVETDASPLIEISYQENEQGAFGWFGLLNHSGQLNTAFHQPIPIHNISIRIKNKRKISGISLLNAGTKISFTQNDDQISFNVPQLNVFEIVLVE